MGSKLSVWLDEKQLQLTQHGRYFRVCRSSVPGFDGAGRDSVTCGEYLPSHSSAIRWGSGLP